MCVTVLRAITVGSDTGRCHRESREGDCCRAVLCAAGCQVDQVEEGVPCHECDGASRRPEIVMYDRMVSVFDITSRQK